MRIGKEDLLPKGEYQNQRNRANITDCHSRKKFPGKKKITVYNIPENISPEQLG